MQRTIQAIIHPYFLHSVPGRNTDLYKAIINGVIEDPNSFLYYISTGPDVITLLNDENKDRLIGYSEDIKLQFYIRSLPQEVRNRISLLTESNGVESWYMEGYRPPSATIISRFESAQECSLSYFARNNSRAYYDRGLTTVYTEVTGIEGMPAVGLIANSTRKFHQEGNRQFLQVPLHPQVAKLVRFLGTEKDGTFIMGESTNTIPAEITHSTRIVGSGEFLEACVFGEVMNLALQLGIPVRNVTLNTEQPYLPELAREGFFYKHPIEAFYPAQRFAESLRPGFRK